MKQTTTILKLIAALAFVTACTKTRQAELPDEAKTDIFAISDFGQVDENSQFSVKTSSMDQEVGSAKSMKALDTSASNTLASEDVNVPPRLKFMFNNLPVVSQAAAQYKVVFSVDKDYVTSYKMVSNAKDLTALEKSIAISTQEAQLLNQLMKASSSEIKSLSKSLQQASASKMTIRDGKKSGSLLVPMFKYKIESYGILERTKNELKESTSVLALKKTDFKDATHVQISARADNRLLVGMSADQLKEMNQLYDESKIDNLVMSVSDLETKFQVNLKFMDGSKQVLTRLDTRAMHVYEITKKSALDDNQLRLLKNNAGNQEVISCQDKAVAAYVNSKDSDCVLLLQADIPITYQSTKLALVDLQGNTSNTMQFEEVPRVQSVGIVSIAKNEMAKQVQISGTLDPNSSVRLADLKGEFFYRRTFEEASNMFLGRTGTSGDMSIVKFELEDGRLVVRNQQSLINYTGQGAKDREEIMSFPVRYIRSRPTSDAGSKLTVPGFESTTKEKAEYALIDWTQNTIPNASSPLSFYDGGQCFEATSSQKVTGTDMRLATDGILNFSLSGSYTMKPIVGCVTIKNVNSAYWAGMLQFNFNIAERISFQRRKNLDSDKQLTLNISSMAQEAFNFGVFTLADKITDNGTFDNRDHSEKYMPMVHDFRNGRKIKYYIGGLNNKDVTSAERRKLMIEATQEVINEWNVTLRYAFRGTTLERSGDYVEVVVDEGDNTGHLGDLDRNYIWYQELPAENGLLGVAQPAANPRSGTIESANVIIYSGNSFDQAERLIAMTTLARQYEKKMEAVRAEAYAEAKKKNAEVSSKEIADAKANPTPATAAPASPEVKKLKAKIEKLSARIDSTAKSLQMQNPAILSALQGLNMKPTVGTVAHMISKDMFKAGKGQDFKYDVNERTFTKKLTELALQKSLIRNQHAFELAVNEAFQMYGGLDEISKMTLQKKADLLRLAARFDDNNKNRPGCFKYERNDIEDAALTLDSDPHKNLMLNFRKTIKSTLSHELGHAFGLLHNFKASFDKANFEFPEDLKQPTGRNYSSIMDYMADIDMEYQGPGPYDAHALRAAYTGMVEIPDDTKDNELVAKVKVTAKNLVSITDVMKAYGNESLVHFTKDTLNEKGSLKYYEQCSDGGLSEHATCAQFDVGSTAVEVVKNKIADYNRGYTTRNAAYDKILFGWPQKIEIMTRNISAFQSIRNYLDEAVMTIIFGGGRTNAENTLLNKDLAKAAQLGYQFFHEVIRTPDAPETTVTNFQNRFTAVPYVYVGAEEVNTDTLKCKKNDKGIILCEDIKVVEARALYDVKMSRDKIDTVGIGFDKVFAMQFLLQSSAAPSTDDSNVSQISYLDFEQWFMGLKDPSKSLTLNTMLDIMTDNLKVGFFAPSRSIDDNRVIELTKSVDINKYLADQTAVASVISLYQAKWRGFDPYADAFKISRASVGTAPKGRFNVVKNGQDRSQSDSRVFFASQNSPAAAIIVKKAARNEAYINNKALFYSLMKEVAAADMIIFNKVADTIQKACSGSEKAAESAECKAVQAMTEADLIKANPELIKPKADADQKAASLVAAIRALNANGLLMDLNLDVPTSGFNFEVQVALIRKNILTQVGLLRAIVARFKETPSAKVKEAIDSAMPLLQMLADQNKKVKPMPLFWLALNFVTDQGKDLNLVTKDEKVVGTGAMITKLLIGEDQLAASQEKLLEVIENLSLYTGLVDPDTVGR